MLYLFIDLDQQIEMFACVFEIEANGNIRRQRIEAPRMIIEQQFMSLVQQAANNTTPIRVKMSRMESVWNQFDNVWVDVENSIEFTNIAWESISN